MSRTSLTEESDIASCKVRETPTIIVRAAIKSVVTAPILIYHHSTNLSSITPHCLHDPTFSNVFSTSNNMLFTSAAAIIALASSLTQVQAYWLVAGHITGFGGPVGQARLI